VKSNKKGGDCAQAGQNLRGMLVYKWLVRTLYLANCYRDGFNKTLENAKPLNDPDGRHLQGFTYLRLGKVLFERPSFFFLI